MVVRGRGVDGALLLLLLLLLLDLLELAEQRLHVEGARRGQAAHIGRAAARFLLDAQVLAGKVVAGRRRRCVARSGRWRFARAQTADGILVRIEYVLFL